MPTLNPSEHDALFSVRIQAEPIDTRAAAIPAELAQRCGAEVRFIGKVRNDPRDGQNAGVADPARALSHLVLEHFPGVTESEIARIVDLARQRWALHAVQVVHRTGRIALGEDIVMVTTHSAHRRDAYEANVFIMDYLKTEAPFWKQECFADGHAHWVEAKGSDATARQRWESAAESAAPAGTTTRRIGALLLAGGQGSRMGRVNKGLVPLDGQPLAAHVVRVLRDQVDALVVSANRDLAAYRALDLPEGTPIVEDEAAYRDLGPLAGIASAVPHLPPDLDAILVVPCDTPHLPADLAARLAAALFAPGAPPAVMAATADGPQPSVFLFRPGLFFSLIQHLQAQRGLSLRSWLLGHGCASVHFDDAAAFVNVNDAATLARCSTNSLQ